MFRIFPYPSRQMKKKMRACQVLQVAPQPPGLRKLLQQLIQLLQQLLQLLQLLHRVLKLLQHLQQNLQQNLQQHLTTLLLLSLRSTGHSQNRHLRSRQGVFLARAS